MTLKLQVTEKEKQSVIEAVSAFKSAMQEASASGQTLLSKLDESFLAIDNEIMKGLKVESIEIGSVMWNLNVTLCKMKEFEERIIKG